MPRKASPDKDTRIAETRHKIRRAALQLFDRYGFEKVTIKMISHECGMGVGTFYNYFDSKEHLLAIQSAENDEWFANTIRQELSMTDPEAFIRAYFRYYGEMNVRIGPELYYRTFGQRGRDDRQTLKRPMFVILEDFISQALLDGALRPDHPTDAIVRAFLLCARGVVLDWCIHNGQYDLVQEMQMALTPLIQYYVTAPKMNDRSVISL
jgi:TetR/AcrR family transcriptional regulator, fatty acid metabolism regulator protein